LRRDNVNLVRELALRFVLRRVSGFAWIEFLKRPTAPLRLSLTNQCQCSSMRRVPRQPKRSEPVRQIGVRLPRKAQREAATRYYSNGVPRNVPAGHIIAHGSVAPTRPDQGHGVNGFRVWRATRTWLAENPQLTVCACGWAPHLGEHYSPIASLAAKAKRDAVATAILNSDELLNQLAAKVGEIFRGFD
jgi:hypothetical protein